MRPLSPAAGAKAMVWTSWPLSPSRIRQPGMPLMRAAAQGPGHGADLAAAIGQQHGVLAEHPGQGLHIEVAHRLAEGLEQPLRLLLLHLAAGVVGLHMLARPADQ